jgi:hypothetical protein
MLEELVGVGRGDHRRNRVRGSAGMGGRSSWPFHLPDRCGPASGGIALHKNVSAWMPLSSSPIQTKHADVNRILDRKSQLLVLHAPRGTDGHPCAIGSYRPSCFRVSFSC